MKGISKSLFASQARVRSAMADAAQASMDTLGYARGDSAAARDAEAVASAFRRGDDGACDPDASLVLVLEHAVGFDEPCLFLAARVASGDGRLKGARAHTLAARRDDSFFVQKTHVSREVTYDDTVISDGAHVFARRRDLRLRAAPGDALLVEAYGADDTSYARGKKTSAWATKCVARGAVSLEHVLGTRGESVRVPLHRALLGGHEEDTRQAYVSVRFLVPSVPAREGDVPPPPDSLDADSLDTDSRIRPLIDLDAGYAPAGAHERYREGTAHALARSPPSSASSRFGNFPKRAKRVFFVRHGESRWNEAQREMHLSAMAKFDHPLNTRGAGQATRAGAEAARHQRSAEGTRSDASDADSDPFDAFAAANATDGHGGDAPRLSAKQLAWWRSFGDATRCFSSPLTRAAQTAALFLFASGKTAKTRREDPAARKNMDEPFVVLSRSLREVKSTMGSLDTIGIERGADGILRRAAEKLRDACHGGVPDAAYADAAVAAMRAETDAGDAFGRWWTSRDDVDSREQMDERVDDFFETLRLEASDAVIVVGHSLWFQHAVRRLCSRAGSRAFVEREKDAARALTSEKIGNCACVGLALAFDAATGEASLEDAAFLLGGGEAE